jgi:hypothetical protein
MTYEQAVAREFKCWSVARKLCLDLDDLFIEKLAEFKALHDSGRWPY